MELLPTLQCVSSIVVVIELYLFCSTFITFKKKQRKDCYGA